MEVVAYRVTPFVTEAGPAVLRDPDDRPLALPIAEYDFCTLAAAGSGVVGRATYQVLGTGRRREADCRTYFRRLARKQPVAAGDLGRARFVRHDWPYGLGADDYRLVPWRSVAIAQVGARLGTVLFAPELRGKRLPDGSVHDGHLLVVDLREEAAGGRIALFAGRTDEAGPEFVPEGGVPRSITVTVVDEPVIAARLRAMHRLGPPTADRASP